MFPVTRKLTEARRRKRQMICRKEQVPTRKSRKTEKRPTGEKTGGGDQVPVHVTREHIT